jgi:hypothetical protein
MPVIGLTCDAWAVDDGGERAVMVDVFVEVGVEVAVDVVSSVGGERIESGGVSAVGEGRVPKDDDGDDEEDARWERACANCFSHARPCETCCAIAFQLYITTPNVRETGYWLQQSARETNDRPPSVEWKQAKRRSAYRNAVDLARNTRSRRSQAAANSALSHC